MATGGVHAVAGRRHAWAASPAPASRATLDRSVLGPSSDLTRAAGAPPSERADLCGAARFFVMVSWQMACERDEWAFDCVAAKASRHDALRM